MQFTELMLIYTLPIFWNEPPEDAPRRASLLRDFLLFLLDPDRPGTGALNSYGVSNTTKPNWFPDGKISSEWVRATYDTVWKPQAEALSVARLTGSQALEEHRKSRAELFLDRERLVACLEAAEINVNVPADIFVNLSVDWEHDDQWLWWAPQLRICNYRPYNPKYAPPLLSGTSAKSASLPLERAADILYSDFWCTVLTAFGELYSKYLDHIGVTLELTPETVLPPVFFYAKPNRLVNVPQDFVSPKQLPTLQKLARRIAGTEDLLSTEVAAALLQGTILSFRREVEKLDIDENSRLETSWRSNYLLIPWLPAATIECLEEAEHDAYLVARQLTCCEFVAGGRRHMDLDKDLLKPTRSLRLLNETAEEAVRLVKRLQRQIAFENQSRVRRDAYEVVRQLHSSIFRLGIELLPVTNKVISKKADWQHITDNVIRDTQSRLAIRALPSMRPLSESLANSRAHMQVIDVLENLAQDGHSIQDKFRSVTASLQDILEQERHEIQDRENVRQQLIGYILAALTASTVFPLLIGQASWKELKDEIGTWPDYLLWLRVAYIEPHRWWTLLAMVSATILIVLLVIALILIARKWGGTNKYSKKLAKGGRIIACIERCIDEGKDKKVCEQLKKVVNLLQPKPLAFFRLPTSGYKATSDQVIAFIIQTELKTRLPIPKGLPRALCLCRYLDVVQSLDNAAQTDDDFSKALEDCDLSSEEVTQVKERAEQYRQRKDWKGLIDWVLGDWFETTSNHSVVRATSKL
ncbi:MAG TPA: hypothetical protein VGE45_10030 [Chloroflexia bacterium]